jgi:hypothetical protein
MELFSAQPELDIEGILTHVPVRVTDEMNEVLDASFTAQEVNRALSMMGAGKAPGPEASQSGSSSTIGRRLGQVSQVQS